MATLPSIREFYAGRSIFITGATGFMGKVLVEKLLRSCPEIGTIYLLVRSKKGVDPVTRLHSLLDCKLFEPLAREQTNFRDKVVPIVGDITEPGLGIINSDRQLLIRDVSIIFHSAATVRFDEHLKLSVQMNMVGVQRMLELARQLPHLEVFEHVSTAYANCDQSLIEERVYPTSLTPHKLIDAVEWMSDEVLDTLTPKLVHPRPNTYTYTKAMAERILEEDAKDLPVVIVRPSIVGATWQEPFPGWVDNFNGPTGLFAAIGKGALRMMMGRRDGCADIIPCDTAINLFIAAAWITALEKPKEMRIFNCTTERLNPLYWGMVDQGSETFFNKIPLDGIARLPKAKFTMSRTRRNLGLYLDHYLPAWLMDMSVRMTGGKPRFVRLQTRLWKAVEVLEFFTSGEWHWTNDNVLMLIDKQSDFDKKEFDFDVRNIDWQLYLDNYCLGTKRYALKESMDDLPLAQKNVTRLHRRDQVMNIAFAITMWGLLAKRSEFFRNITQWSVQQISRLPAILSK